MEKKFDSPLDHIQTQIVLTDRSKFKNELKSRKSIYKQEKRINKKDKHKPNEIKGFTFLKETKTIKHYVKKKSQSELFEDRIWLFLHNMGASVLNNNNSKIILNEHGKTKQIDVFGKIGKTILIIECKTAAEESSKSLRKEIAEVKEYKEPIIRLLRELWGESIKVCFLFAVENIKLSKSDLHDLEHYNIKLWNSGLIKYFEDLVGLLGESSKYQIFAETFGEDKIVDHSPTIPAIKGTANDTNFFYFLVRPESLLRIAYIHHRKLKRDENFENPYQRMVNKKRIDDIRNFVSDGGSFANNVIVSFKRSPRFKSGGTTEGIEFGTLTLPEYYKSAWIIDGQHRLFGYTNTVEAKNELIPVYAFEGLSLEKQGTVFIDVNKNQKSVESNLLWDLYSDIYFETDDEHKKILYTISQITKKINSVEKSKLQSHIYIPSMNDKSEVANITMTTLCNRIFKSPLLKRKSGSGDFIKSTSDRTIELTSKRIIYYFNQIAKCNPDDWSRGEKGLTRSNTGINVFFVVFIEIIKTFRAIDNNPIFNDKQYKKEIDKLVKPIKTFLNHEDKVEIENIKSLSSEKGISESAKKICKIINDNIKSFVPEILNDIVFQEDEPIKITNRNQAIDIVEKGIRNEIHSFLMDANGPDYWEKEGAIPSDIKVAVKSRILDELKRHPYKHIKDYESGERRIQFCDIMDYNKIIITKVNWDKFKGLFHSKEQLTQRLLDLNEFRKKVKHNREDEAVDPIVSRNGEAAIIWFSKIFELDLDY